MLSKDRVALLLQFALLGHAMDRNVFWLSQFMFGFGSN